MVCHKGNSSVCLSVIQPEVGELIYLRNGDCVCGCGFLLAKTDSEKCSLPFLPCIFFLIFLSIILGFLLGLHYVQSTVKCF